VRDPRWHSSLAIIDSSHLFALGTSPLGLSRLRRWWEAGGKFLKVLRLGRRREDVRVIGGLLLAKQTAHRRGLGRRFTVASLEAMAALDGRKLLARSSHFRCICNDTAAFVVALGEDAVREVLPWGRRRTKAWALPAGDRTCSRNSGR